MSEIFSDAPPAAAAVDPAAPGRIRPSAAWYWIGAAILVLGSVGAIVWFVISVVRIGKAPDDYVRMPLASERVLSFNETGRYVVFAETTATVTGSTDLGGPEVTVTGTDGATVPVRPHLGSSTYNVGGHHGSAYLQFDIAVAGTYQVKVGEVARQSGIRPVTGVAIGKDLPASAIVGVVASLILGAVTFVLGLVVLIVTAVRRSRARRRLQPPRPRPPAYAPGGPPPYPGPYGAPAPGPYPGQAPYAGPYGAPAPGPYPGQPPHPGPHGAPAAQQWPPPSTPQTPESPPAGDDAPPQASPWPAPDGP